MTQPQPTPAAGGRGPIGEPRNPTTVALLAGAHDPARGALEALGVGDRRAAELHDDGAGHGGGV